MYIHIRVSFRKMGKGGQNNTYGLGGTRGILNLYIYTLNGAFSDSFVVLMQVT